MPTITINPYPHMTAECAIPEDKKPVIIQVSGKIVLPRIEYKQPAMKEAPQPTKINIASGEDVLC